MGIRCTSCSYDNDPTRVYCHNCGVKLERGRSDVKPPTGFTHPTDVAKMKRPRQPIPWGKHLGFLLRLCVYTALIAAVIMALLPPRNLPAPMEPDKGVAARLNGLLGDSATAAGPRGFAVPAADVQRWLVTVARPDAPEDSLKLRPQRVYSEQGEGFIRVGLETSLLGALNLYFEGDYAPLSAGEDYQLRPLRFSVGRLPVPVVLGWPVEWQFAGLCDALAAPLEYLSRASHIGIAPDAVTLRWAGTDAQ